MSTAISVEHISKAYRLGMIGGGSLRADVSRLWARMRGRPDPFLRIGQEHLTRKEGEVFWALRDVNFKVRLGEVLGVIGRNGAGKSTLLKILSRVTGPTEGRIRVKGRIASLLEVGTGFHPELTGRENVFLNGAILGMTKAEIRSKFDEIVAFAEIDDFIDTPVKRYSSGMYVRLAFAVAAHLEPEILIVDEVLAVGDAGFQKKCLGKMQDVAGHGRTVLFVSHNLHAVTRLCTSAVLIDSGKLVAEGSPEAMVQRYQQALRPVSGDASAAARAQVPEGEARFVSWELVRGGLDHPHCCLTRSECVFRFVFSCRRQLRRVHFGFVIRASDETILISGHNLNDQRTAVTLEPGEYHVEWTTRVPLPPGNYRVEVGAASEDEAPRRADDWVAEPDLEVVENRPTVLPPSWLGSVREWVDFNIVPAHGRK